MKSNIQEKAKFNLRSPFYGKRDYYFHADEDFREDHEWGKSKSGNTKASSSSRRTTTNA